MVMKRMIMKTKYRCKYQNFADWRWLQFRICATERFKAHPPVLPVEFLICCTLPGWGGQAEGGELGRRHSAGAFQGAGAGGFFQFCFHKKNMFVWFRIICAQRWIFLRKINISSRTPKMTLFVIPYISARSPRKAIFLHIVVIFPHLPQINVFFMHNWIRNSV